MYYFLEVERGDEIEFYGLVQHGSSNQALINGVLEN